MKIFIGCSEICGLINVYANAFRQLGHDVTTCVEQKNIFYPSESYNIQSNFWADFVLGRNTSDNNVGKKLTLPNKFALKLRQYTTLFDHFIEKRIIDQHDVFIFIWAGNYLMRDFKDLRLIKEKGKSIISILVGSDVRNAHAFMQEFKIDSTQWPEKYKNPRSHHHHILRNVERYSDIILSVPDQMSLAIRPYDHFHLPLNFDKLTYRINTDRKIPKVVHAPSNPAIKGTDVIMETLDRLKKEGVEFEPVLIQNMSNQELLKVLQDADLVVDELVLHGPGVLSLEAMASGCATATRHLENSPACFRPPVESITAENIYKKVKRLIEDKEYRISRAVEGRKYVEENNKAEIIASDLLRKIEEGYNRKYDYYPSYFVQKFVPESMLSTMEKAENYTMLTKWLDNGNDYIKSMKERGLV